MVRIGESEEADVRYWKAILTMSAGALLERMDPEAFGSPERLTVPQRQP